MSTQWSRKAVWAASILLSSALGAVIGLGAQSQSARDNADTVLGALLDSTPLDVRVGGTNIRVFDAARNELYRNQGPVGWRNLTHYFDAPLEIVRAGGNGRPGLSVFSLPSSDVVQFELHVKDIDREALAEAIRAAGKNAYADSTQVLPLRVFRVEVQIPTLPTTVIESEAGISLDTPLSVQLQVPSGTGQAWATQFTNGLAITVRLLTLTKLTQLTQLRATWDQVVKTSAYQKYLGPSGPQFITAAQAERIMANITTELGYFQWQEGSPATYADLLKELRGQLFEAKTRSELRLEEAADPTKLLINVGQLNKVDVIRRLATDSKQLNNSEWCKKYSQSWSDAQDITRDVETGVNVFGYFGGHTNGDFSENRQQTGQSAQSDCGKHQVESSFHFEMEGERYIPKSIYVINRVKSQQGVAARTQAFAYGVSQRYGYFTKTVSLK